MRSRRPSPEHEQAVARRLAALSAQWDAARVEDRESSEALALEPDDEWSWEAHTQVRGVVVPSGAENFETVPEPELLSGTPSGTSSGVSPGALPATAPVPGRHAARRSLGAVLQAPALPLERFGLRGTHLVWVGLFAAAALAFSAWWVVQSRDVELVTPVAASVAPSSGAPDRSPSADTAAVPAGGSADESAGAGAPVGEVVVDVAGKVRRPGIVVLPVGARVVDALESAGGARKGVDLQPLNLARVLQDGEQVVVGADAPAPPAPEVASGTATPGALVNLNTAAPSELESLPGVGPVTAAAIVEWRTRHGGFTSVEDLLEVHGIGAVTLERLVALVTV